VIDSRPQLVATDLDGTLLRADGTMSLWTRQILRRVHTAGIRIVPVTGRPPRTVATVLHDFDVGNIVIAQNGALVYDLRDGTIIDHNPMSRQIANDVMARIRLALPEACFAVEVEMRFGCEPRYAMLRAPNEQYRAWRDDALITGDGPVSKLLAIHPQLQGETLTPLIQELIGDSVTCTHSGLAFAEMCAAGVTKAHALARLCARLGVHAKDVIAFGDMPNDLSMLRWAGCGIAMSNAHPLVLAEIRKSALSNQEDGVAHVLAQIIQPDD
jgi:Cof subfamily protein (haloacid dehalogenase superfamily)